MANLPRLTGTEMARFLQRQGFTLLRVRGSHHYLGRGDQHTSVPVHRNQTLKIGTLRGILRDINLSPDEFADRWPG
ncbi:MAG: type II toxin-antitoxin system HicA family toxin [Pirellulaceae bacterium]